MAPAISPKWLAAVPVIRLLCLAGLVSGQTPLTPAVSNEENLTVITSEKLTFDYAKHYALFEENVVVTDPQLKILSDKLTVIFDDNSKAKSVKAEGQVYLIQLDKKTKSDVADYDVASGEIVLTGHPQVTRGNDTLTGEKITFWRNENRMLCFPKARLVIHPGSESKSALSGAVK